MTWLAPGAFAALALLAGPVIVHLLARQHARRLIFPATHFVPATQAAAVTLRRPSDIGLLLLRLAMVAAAILAAAQPLILTPWRLARWNARVSRAVVVDSSRSVPAPDVASRLADQEMANAFAAMRLHTPDLADGVDRAVRWLEATAPSRREIVVISDFQTGGFDDRIIAAIPDRVGLRLLRAGVLADTRQVTAPPVEGWRGGIWQPSATIDAAGTRASWTRRGNAPGIPRWISVVSALADAGAADRALRAAVAIGVPPGDESRRVLVNFTGATARLPPPEPVRSPWIASAARVLRHSDLLRGLDPPTILEREGVMVVETPVAATDLAAPAIVRAVILAVRSGTIVDPEAETSAVPDASLTRWHRDPLPVTGPTNGVADESQARWLWALALLLLAVESYGRRGSVRRQTASATGEAHADAA